MNYLLLGLLIGVIASAVLAFQFGFERQREVYDQLVATVEADRDAARNEAKVFRGLLFPSINKAEANLGDVRNRPAQHSGEDSPTVSRTTPKDASARRRVRSRVPFRLMFNEMRKQTNTPQIKTDALADAIAQVQKSQQAQVPSQEKTHV